MRGGYIQHDGGEVSVRSEVGQFVGLLHEWLLRPKTASLLWLIVYCSSFFCLSSLFLFLPFFLSSVWRW